MKDETMKIEQRLQNMNNFYNAAEKILDRLPESIPYRTRYMLKDAILGNQELKKLMEGIDAHRPPRIFLIGRTGVGKSSLVNAICGSYAAPVNDVQSCTEGAHIYTCMDGDRELMEICDTRGFAESDPLDPDVPAEQLLIDQINDFSPDVTILMLNCTHRDDVDSDVIFLKKLAKKYAGINDLRMPVVVVVNKCDEMAPSRYKDPKEYPQSKLEKIGEVVQYYKGIIMRNGLKIDDIVPVSSLIDWAMEDGTEIDTEEIGRLPVYDIEHLQMAFDGRYNIEELIDVLENAIQDFDAQMGLRMAARLDEVVLRLSRHLRNVFSTIAAGVALSPLPVADIYVLLALQAVMVALIASLSGRDASIETAREFILSLGGITGAGLVFRTTAQQLSKFINIFWPGAGSAVSSGIAGFGTTAIGNAAIAYYIEGRSMEDVRKKYEMERKARERAGRVRRRKPVMMLPAPEDIT